MSICLTYWKEGGLESPIPTVLGIGGCISDDADITDCWSSLPVSDTLLVSDVTSCNKNLWLLIRLAFKHSWLSFDVRNYYSCSILSSIHSNAWSLVTFCWLALRKWTFLCFYFGFLSWSSPYYLFCIPLSICHNFKHFKGNAHYFVPLSLAQHFIRRN